MPFQSEKQRRFLHANHPEIAKRWERDYGEGGIAALNAQLNQLPEYYLPAAHGGRIGFHRGSLRHQKEHDYKAYEDEGNFMKYLMLSGDRAKMSSPENVINRLVNPKMGYTQKRDDFETWQKERFMYGEKKDPLINLSKSELDKKINTWLKDLFAKKNGEDFIDDEELNLVKGGIANHFQKRVKLQASVESLSDTEFQTMYPDWDPNQFTREEYLQFISENEGNGVLDLSTNEEAIEVASTEENEIIPDLLAPGSAAGILRLKDGGRTNYIYGGITHPGGRRGFPGGSGRADDRPMPVGGSGANYGGPPGGGDPQMTYTAPHVPHYKEEEETRKAALKKAALDVAEEKYDTKEQREAEVYGLRKWQEKEKRVTKLTADFIKDNLKRLNATKYYSEKYGDDIIGMLKKGWEVYKSIPAPTLLGIAKELMAEYKLTKEGNAVLAEWEDLIGGPPGTNPQAYDDLWLALEKRKDKYRYDEDEGPDGLSLTGDVLAETKEAVEEAPDMISLWDRIKANQAKRAMLVEKNIIQDSPIVDESVTDITTMANKGGLANLFRVKNQ